MLFTWSIHEYWDVLQHKLYSSDPTSVFKDKFLNPEKNQYEAWCTSWLDQYLQFQALMYTTTAVVVGVNLFFRLLLKPIVKFENKWYADYEL